MSEVKRFIRNMGEIAGIVPKRFSSSEEAIIYAAKKFLGGIEPGTVLILPKNYEGETTTEPEKNQNEEANQ